MFCWTKYLHLALISYLDFAYTLNTILLPGCPWLSFCIWFVLKTCYFAVCFDWIICHSLICFDFKTCEYLFCFDLKTCESLICFDFKTGESLMRFDFKTGESLMRVNFSIGHSLMCFNLSTCVPSMFVNLNIRHSPVFVNLHVRHSLISFYYSGKRTRTLTNRHASMSLHMHLNIHRDMRTRAHIPADCKRWIRWLLSSSIVHFCREEKQNQPCLRSEFFYMSTYVNKHSLLAHADGVCLYSLRFTLLCGKDELEHIPKELIVRTRADLGEVIKYLIPQVYIYMYMYMCMYVCIYVCMYIYALQLCPSHTRFWYVAACWLLVSYVLPIFATLWSLELFGKKCQEKTIVELEPDAEADTSAYLEVRIRRRPFLRFLCFLLCVPCFKLPDWIDTRWFDSLLVQRRQTANGSFHFPQYSARMQ